MNDADQIVLALLAEHGPRVHALLVRITLRDDVAEDLMQELFLKLSRPNTLERAVDPVGYTIRAAMRLAFDWRRSQRRRRDTATIVGEPALEYEPEIDRLERREDLQAVLDAIARLPADSRDIVVMRYLEGLPYDEIAGALGKTPHQTRALCYKAIVRLRRMTNSRDTITVTAGGIEHEP